MRKLITIALFAAPMAIVTSAQADVLAPISSTIGSIETSSNYDMDQHDSFKASNGLEINIHASRNDDNRVLVMDAEWSAFTFITSSINEANAKEAALEYAKSHKLNVSLSDPEKFYYDGAYGYSFKVAVK